VTLSPVLFCDVCGEALTDVACQHIERRTKIDIVFEKVVEHVDAEVKLCPSCDSRNKGEFPVDMPGPLQYGSGLKAYVINLLVCHIVAINRTQKWVKSMIGVIISEATLLKFVLHFYQALETWEVTATQILLKQKAINVDETSLKVEKTKHWIHVYSSGNITLKFLHKGREKEAILLRELIFIIEANDYVWAKALKRLLQAACNKVSKRKRKKEKAVEKRIYPIA